jgi:hypothetical protein
LIMVDEGAAAPGLDPHRPQREFALVEQFLVEQMPAVNEGVLAIHVPAPAVEGADEAALGAVAVVVAFAPRDRHAAVAAVVVKGLHPVLGPDHDHRLADIRIFDPVAHLRDLLEPAGHLPDLWP